MKKIENLKEEINSSCRFCLRPDTERILYETDNFYVLVSLGPIVEGYLLIVTKAHIGACLNIPEELLPEFLLLKEKVREILIKTYGACLFYEHGKIGSSLLLNNSSKHCYHAHLHCIPVAIDLNSIIEKELSYNSFKTYEEAYLNMNKVEKYLYVENHTINIYQSSKTLRKQYLRFKLAKALGKNDEWDWVNNQNWSLIEQSVAKLKPYFK